MSKISRKSICQGVWLTSKEHRMMNGFFLEMVLPPNANVYYAVNTIYNLNFILRSKLRPLDSPASPGKPVRARNGKKHTS